MPTFLSWFKKPLRKVFGDPEAADGVRPYPNAKKFTTHDFQYSTLAEYAVELASHARAGHCMLKGDAKHELRGESRAGLVDNSANTSVLVLDIDGLHLPDQDFSGPYNSDRVKQVAETVVNLLPEPFRTVSYVACASSSCGLRADVRIHLHFLLSMPISPKRMKHYLRCLNVLIPETADSLQLAAAGKTLKYVIDPCLANNSHLLYIAAPGFMGEVKNPFGNDDDRIVYIEKAQAKLNLLPLLDTSLAVDQLQTLEEDIIIRRHKDRGTKYVKAKTRKIKTFEGEQDVIINPSRAEMTLAYHNDTFAYYNVHTPGHVGDSNAYFVPLNKPDIVFNFKSEPPFLFAEMDPDEYAAHCERFADKINAVRQAEGDRHPNVHQVGNEFLVTLHDVAADCIVDSQRLTSIEKVENYFSHYGANPPDNPPIGYEKFIPRQNDPYHLDTKQQTVINTFCPTEYMRQDDPSPIAGLNHDNCLEIKNWCPRIYQVVEHILAGDLVAMRHFFNWLAFVWQERQKPETTWVFQGIQGTGKGVFFRQVVEPMWGQDYAREVMLDDITGDMFNKWISNLLFLSIDEVNMGAGKKASIAADKLKNWVTAPSLSIRGMRAERVDVRSYFAVMMSTNRIDALQIDPHDRRFNIGPRQERKLVDKYPEYIEKREEVDDEFAEERTVFASLLTEFAVDKPRARTDLKNDAKVVAMEAGMSSAELFFHSIRTGDLAFFTDILWRSETQPDALLQLNKGKNIVISWMRGMKKGQSMEIMLDDVRHMYSAFEGDNVAANRFGRLLKPQGLFSRRTNRGRIMDVEWHIAQEDLEAAFDRLDPQQASTLGNITQMRK